MSTCVEIRLFRVAGVSDTLWDDQIKVWNGFFAKHCGKDGLPSARPVRVGWRLSKGVATRQRRQGCARHLLPPAFQAGRLPRRILLGNRTSISQTNDSRCSSMVASGMVVASVAIYPARIGVFGMQKSSETKGVTAESMFNCGVGESRF